MKITRLKTGRYRVQIYDEFGVRRRHSFAKKGDAEAYLAKVVKAKRDKELLRHKLAKRRIPFEQVIADYWSNKTLLSLKTRQKYQCELRFVEDFIQHYKVTYLDEFKREHADLFRDVLIANSASPKTVNSYIARLKALLNEQVDRDNLVKSPASHLKNVPLKRKTLLEKEGEYYTEDEVRVFFLQKMSEEDKNAFLGLYLTGMRFEELSSLTWERIDFKDRMIKIRTTGEFTTKTPSSERDIPIANMLLDILTDQKQKEVSDYVFPSLEGKKISERTLLSVCKKVAKDAGIKKNAKLHSFRHTFSSLLSQAGIAFEVREYLLGHKPAGSLTWHYTKQNPVKFHYVVGILEDVIKLARNN